MRTEIASLGNSSRKRKPPLTCSDFLNKKPEARNRTVVILVTGKGKGKGKLPSWLWLSHIYIFISPDLQKTARFLARYNNNNNKVGCNWAPPQYPEPQLHLPQHHQLAPCNNLQGATMETICESGYDHIPNPPAATKTGMLWANSQSSFCVFVSCTHTCALARTRTSLLLR